VDDSRPGDPRSDYLRSAVASSPLALTTEELAAAELPVAGASASAAHSVASAVDDPGAAAAPTPRRHQQRTSP
jgi:hypothetical protein